MEEQTSPARPIYSRRHVLALGGAAAATLVAACSSDVGGSATTATGVAPSTTAGGVVTQPVVPASVPATTVAPLLNPNAATFGGGGADGTIKIGLLAPLTGLLAAYGEADTFVIDAVTKLAAGGVQLGGKSYKVEIVEKDAESSADTAAARADELIGGDAVDVVLAVGPTEIVNAVADKCEASGVPCLSTLAPWQSYFQGRGGDIATGFAWTYHFFWGTDQVVAVFVDLWKSVDTNLITGLLCPDDIDGNALASIDTGFTAGGRTSGYTIVDPGRFEPGNADFADIVGQLQDEHCEIVVGVSSPADFAAFWAAAATKNFKPKLVTMAEAVSFSSAVEALGAAGDGLAADVWWSPRHPFRSSLTGERAADLSSAYESGTGKRWTQAIGSLHALFEVCFDALARAGSADKQAIAAALAATKLDTVVGLVQFGVGANPRNVARTPLVGGQWQPSSGPSSLDLFVTNNLRSPDIPVAGVLQPLP